MVRATTVITTQQIASWITDTTVTVPLGTVGQLTFFVLVLLLGLFYPSSIREKIYCQSSFVASSPWLDGYEYPCRKDTTTLWGGREDDGEWYTSNDRKRNNQNNEGRDLLVYTLKGETHTMIILIFILSTFCTKVIMFTLLFITIKHHILPHHIHPLLLPLLNHFVHWISSSDKRDSTICLLEWRTTQHKQDDTCEGNHHTTVHDHARRWKEPLTCTFWQISQHSSQFSSSSSLSSESYSSSLSSFVYLDTRLFRRFFLMSFFVSSSSSSSSSSFFFFFLLSNHSLLISNTLLWTLHYWPTLITYRIQLYTFFNLRISRRVKRPDLSLFINSVKRKAIEGLDVQSSNAYDINNSHRLYIHPQKHALPLLWIYIPIPSSRGLYSIQNEQWKHSSCVLPTMTITSL